ncbi:DoxX family protein [Microbacterium sp. SD291]|uniref:DoxX family protein n=1 Tax=Microbacterium sp. SD291 TaxID=2782007 RepID=UPI001A969B20|nr:MauE/DoxX family redox-associated membrane protein [Microbacterium sp. SD291]MBO0980988.1 hypothetical protein [Microbacterium sp. SD291]
MPTALAVMPALIVGVVLIFSGVLKAGAPADMHELETLGVPAPLRRRWLVVLHPWAEIALGLALIALGGVLGVLAGLAATVLMAGYLWLVSRALRTAPDASCSCFGSSRPVTRATVVRNAWLTALSAAAAAVSWANPLLGGPVAALGWEGALWVLGAAAAALTAALIVRPDGAEPAASESTALSAPQDADESEYFRTRTPAVAVTLADGTTTNLRLLASRRPTLLLAVSETCGSCQSVIDGAVQWRERLPEVDVRLMVTLPPESSTLADTTAPQTLHDPQGLVAESLGPWRTPSAVLLGVDGMLAGGPVSGPGAVEEFVAEIEESLRELRPAGG